MSASAGCSTQSQDDLSGTELLGNLSNVQQVQGPLAQRVQSVSMKLIHAQRQDDSLSCLHETAAPYQGTGSIKPQVQL